MAAWILARGAARARSAAAGAASSSSSSGASAAKRSSVSVTAWSFACSANNASSSGCTSPPRRDLVSGVALAELVEHPALLRNQGRLPVGTLEGQLLVELLQLALQPPRLDPLHRPLAPVVGIPP